MTQHLSTMLGGVLADTYALYLKSQNYHWHVEGVHFKERHELFEEHYTELAGAIDELAERIVTLGGRAPGTFTEMQKLQRIPDATGTEHDAQMVEALLQDHAHLARVAKEGVQLAEKAGDVVTADLLTGRAAVHEKTAWMLRSIAKS